MTPAQRRRKTWQGSITRPNSAGPISTTTNGCLPILRRLATTDEEMIQNISYLEMVRSTLFPMTIPMDRLRVFILRRGLSMKHNPGFLKAVETAKKSIRETDVPTIARRLKAGERFHFVDVREDDEWIQGRAKGSIHIGKGVIERDIETKIPNKNEEIVLYCGGGFRSALAAESLQKLGYTNVISMDGGIKAWREAGLPEDRDY